MYRTIYIASDGTGMTREDVWDWLKYIIDNHNGYDHLDFDKLIGGKEEFDPEADYYKLKSLFEAYKKAQVSKQIS